MSMNAYGSLLGPPSLDERFTSVNILAPTVTTSTLYPSGKNIDWSNPTVTSTVRGMIQPASDKALKRLGITARQGVHTAYLEPIVLPPLARIKIGSVTYSVLDVRAWGTHTEATVEVVA